MCVSNECLASCSRVSSESANDLLVICRNASLSVRQFAEQMIQTVSKTCQTTVIRECLESVLERSVLWLMVVRERGLGSVMVEEVKRVPLEVARWGSSTSW